MFDMLTYFRNGLPNPTNHKGPTSRQTTGRRSSKMHELVDGTNSTCTKVHEQRIPQRDTVIIFDWDDTLLSSSALLRHQWNPIQMRHLAECVQRILQTAMGLGDTVIVTNGGNAWVQESAAMYMPSVLPMLEQLQVMSARAKYESLHPGQPLTWKHNAFKDVLGPRAAAGKCLNLIVLGDSLVEIEAAYTWNNGIGKVAIVKTVKFQEGPTINELLGQLRRTCQDLPLIVDEASGGNIGLIQRTVPVHFDFMSSWASKWKFVDREEWCFPRDLAGG